LAIVTHESLTDLQSHFSGHVAVAERLGTPLVVVDNASTDGTVEFLDRWRSRSNTLRPVTMPRNLGFAAAVNRAFREVPGRDMLLLNADVELRDAEPVECLSAYLARNAGVGVAAPRLVYPDQTTQPSARRFPSVLALVGSLSMARALKSARRSYDSYVEPSQATTARTVDWVIGAAMLIRRAAFDAVGGWDERFFLYMEDADFCRRCARAGWQVAYVPGVAMRHGYARESTASGASVATSRARRRHVVSLARFFSRDPRLLFGRR
jgi:N-acetylglucosaminyl-diphospho-decaprenol L-rhamnosyltransferase